MSEITGHLLGVDCSREAPVLRALMTAVDAGVRVIDVGDPERSEIRKIFRELRGVAHELHPIVRLNLRGRSMRTAVDAAHRALGATAPGCCLIPNQFANRLSKLRTVVEEEVGICDPSPAFLTRWRTGLDAAVSIRTNLHGILFLAPYLRASGNRPVFLGWDPIRSIENAVQLAPLSAAADAAGISLAGLALGLPLYTPGVTTVLIPAVDSVETSKFIEAAMNLNPDSRLMASFLDLVFTEADIER